MKRDLSKYFLTNGVKTKVAKDVVEAIMPPTVLKMIGTLKYFILINYEYDGKMISIIPEPSLDLNDSIFYLPEPYLGISSLMSSKLK